VRAVKTDDKSNKVMGMQPALIHAVIQDQGELQKSPTTVEKSNETQQFVNVPTLTAVEKARALMRTTDSKAMIAKTAVTKAVRPSIIKKTVIKDGISVSPVTTTTVVSLNFGFVISNSRNLCT
jgi:hypothetical protein